MHRGRKSGSPRFPVEFGGFGELHAPFFTERRTRGSLECIVAGNPGPPDFLWNLVASVNFMRLSSRKGAHAVLSNASWQEIRVPPDFLWNLVASVNFMRLSSRKGAHAVLSNASWQEIRVPEMAKKCELSELIRLLRGFSGFGGL